MTWIGFKRAQVTFTKGAELLRDYASSPGTNRRYCGHCGTRIMFESSAPIGPTRSTCPSASS